MSDLIREVTLVDYELLYERLPTLLRDVYPIIISFTDGPTFCSCFSVCKEFLRICTKLKNTTRKTITTIISGIILPTSFLNNILPKSMSKSIGSPSIRKYGEDILSLYLNRNKIFRQLTIERTYNNIRLSDTLIDKKDHQLSEYRVFTVYYTNNKIHKGEYYLTSRDKNRIEFIVVNDNLHSMVIVDNDIKGMLVNCSFDTFYNSYRKVLSKLKV